MKTRLHLTHHAIERFRVRHVKHLTLAEAEIRLATLAVNAVLLPEKTILGQMQYLTDDDVILVVKDDPTMGLVAVTTLTATMQAPTREDTEEFLAAVERDIQARKRPTKCDRPTTIAPTVFTARKEIRDAQIAVVTSKRAAKRAATKAEGLARHAATLAKQAKAKADRKAAKEAKAAMPNDVLPKPKQVTISDQPEWQVRYEKAKFQLAYQEQREKEAANALRFALRALLPYVDRDQVATEAWDSIASMNAGFVSEKFINIPIVEQETTYNV